MALQDAVKSLLDGYQTRLGIDGSANILVLDEDMASTLKEWCKQLSSFSQPVVTVSEKDTPAVESWPYNETEYSHLLAVITAVDKPNLQFLKWIQYSLRWKGIAILVFAGVDSSDAVLIDWIEKASFERGKIRVLSQQDPAVRLVLAMKWDLLSA